MREIHNTKGYPFHKGNPLCYCSAMERPVAFAVDEIYHVYNRGVEKRAMFMDSGDYERMMLLLYLCNSKTPVNIRDYLARGFTYSSLWSLDIDKPIVAIGAWCLMPNHFHLLLHEIKEGGISQFMLKITTAYSMYFNRKMERTGSLVQGPFKSEHVTDDRYLQYLFSYIHLNPVKLIPGESSWKENGIRNLRGAQTYLEKFKYSSLPDYMHPNSRIESKLIQPDAFPWKFNSLKDLNAELLDWLTYNKDS